MALITAGYWPTTYWPSRYWIIDYWPEYGYAAVVSAIPVGGGPERRRKKKKRGLPGDQWHERASDRVENDRQRRAKALALQEKVVARAEHGAYMAQAEKVVDAWIKANREEEEATKRRMAERAAREAQLLKQRLLNLEKAKSAKAKKREREEEIRQKRLKGLKKARAAKKRKRKKEK